MPKPLTVVAIETTGLILSEARVEFAALKIQPGVRPGMLRARVNPGRPIPRSATEVHDITDVSFRHLPPFEAYARRTASFLEGADLAGYNLAEFDLPFLAREFERCGVPLPMTDRLGSTART